MGMRINIIGSGMAGLVSGALLSKAGWEVHLYEQNADIGGVTGGFRKKGFYWDMGQLNIEGLGLGEQAGRVIDELGLWDKLKLIPADRLYDFPGFTVKPPEMYQGSWWRRDFLIRQFPQEKRGIKRYFRYYMRMREIVTLAERSESSTGLKAALFKAGMYSRLLPLLPKAKWSAKRLMDNFFKSPEIKAVFTSILADFVVRPEEFQGLGVALVNPETAFDCRVPLELSRTARQPSYTCIDGGCRTLVDLLADVIRTNGGHIHTGSEVIAIRTKDGKAVGIELLGGSFQESQVVIASGGAKETFSLLKPDEINAEFLKIVNGVPLMESVFMIHLGLDIDPRDYLESGVNYCYRTYDISGSVDKLQNGVYHEGEDGYLICSPSFYSPQSAPEGRYAVTIYTVAPNEAPGCEWSERKEYYTNRLLDLAAEKLAAIREHIVEMEVFTPDDFKKLTRQSHHSFGGCAPVMNKKAVPYRTPVSGLWFIGSQSESGAGISNVVTGAHRVCRMIMDECSSLQWG